MLKCRYSKFALGYSISFTFYLLCVIKFSVLTKNIEEINRDYSGPSTIDPSLYIWTVNILGGGGRGTNELLFKTYAIYKNFAKVK